MTQNRKRPKYIQALIDHVNHTMWNENLKLDETNRLFFSIQEFLIHNGWYRGFNFFHDEVREVKHENPMTGVPYVTHERVHVLHGSDQGYDFIMFM